ncbi:hypothetical protein B0H10DRAFT_1958044 [Mycena sp. CBHHK59/15]|nr:hypothetical protein B0H10DRAFT_1958044 [Mycena sp. CBHHK59/15]
MRSRRMASLACVADMMMTPVWRYMYFPTGTTIFQPAQVPLERMRLETHPIEISPETRCTAASLRQGLTSTRRAREKPECSLAISLQNLMTEEWASAACADLQDERRQKTNGDRAACGYCTAESAAASLRQLKIKGVIRVHTRRLGRKSWMAELDTARPPPERNTMKPGGKHFWVEGEKGGSNLNIFAFGLRMRGRNRRRQQYGKLVEEIECREPRPESLRMLRFDHSRAAKSEAETDGGIGAVGYIPVAVKNCGNSAFMGFPILTAEDHLFDRNRDFELVKERLFAQADGRRRSQKQSSYMEKGTNMYKLMSTAE